MVFCSLLIITALHGVFCVGYSTTVTSNRLDLDHAGPSIRSRRGTHHLIRWKGPCYDEYAEERENKERASSEHATVRLIGHNITRYEYAGDYGCSGHRESSTAIIQCSHWSMSSSSVEDALCVNLSRVWYKAAANSMVHFIFSLASNDWWKNHLRQRYGS